MKSIKEMYNLLNYTTDFKEKYPQFNLDDKKIHVLFLSPCLNETGYYRMILPALELNRTESHAAILGHIHKWDFNKLFDDYDNPVDLRLVRWADYVVLPAMFNDAEYIIKAMREINNNIDFVMDIDCNYHQLPEYHPDFKKLTEPMKDGLISNLAKVDILTAPNSLILNYYNNLSQAHEKRFSLYFDRYPNLLSHYAFEETPQIFQNNGPRVRIGLIVDASQGEDVRIIEAALKSLLEVHADKIELILFGWSAKVAEQLDILKEVKIVYEKPVGFIDYYARLNALALDVGILSYADNPFNVSGKALNRYLDFSALMIPVVAANIVPFSKIIRDGENGFIAGTPEEWQEKITRLIADKELRKEIGGQAFKYVWEKFSVTPKAIARLKSIFV